ncbi:MAG: DNA-3-methyladenine glycosylase I [Sphingomonadales bacterium]
MRAFDEIHDLAVLQAGSAERIEQGLQDPLSAAQLAAIPDDRWLAAITKRVFQAGFVWRVIANKWPGFEAAFEGFDPGRWMMMSDEDLDRLLADPRVVRNAQKIMSVPGNARMIVDVSGEYGGFGRFIANWPDDDYVGLLAFLKKYGSRLGGNSAQYLLRFMGKDAFILTDDVIRALIRESVVDKPPASKSAIAAVQAAFNQWRAQSGRPFNHISRILAFSAG